MSPSVALVVQKQDDLRLYWVQYKDPSLESSLKYRLPPSIQELFRCITPHPVRNIYDVTVEEGQVRRQGAAGD